MGMTPDQFFEAFVRANFEDYQRHPGCIRRAFNAAVSASHLADHYFAYYKKHDPSMVNSFNKIGDFVEYLSCKTNGCFRNIRSISNAYKHLYTSIDPKKAVYSSIPSTGAIESVTFDYMSAEVKMLEENWKGYEGNFKSNVVFTRKDGQQVEFLPTLETVINFFEKMIYQIN